MPGCKKTIVIYKVESRGFSTIKSILFKIFAKLVQVDVFTW